MTAEQKLNKFRTKARKLVDKLDELIDKLPHKGDKCLDSQKVCLKQALQYFDSSINGLAKDDFKKIKTDDNITSTNIR